MRDGYLSIVSPEVTNCLPPPRTPRPGPAFLSIPTRVAEKIENTLRSDQKAKGDNNVVWHDPTEFSVPNMIIVMSAR